jgi:hypothetical protein
MVCLVASYKLNVTNKKATNMISCVERPGSVTSADKADRSNSLFES